MDRIPELLGEIEPPRRRGQRATDGGYSPGIARAPLLNHSRVVLRGLAAGIPLTFLGLFLCAGGAHVTPLLYLGIPLVPMALVIRAVTGRDIGQPGMYAVFWVLQLAYYVLLSWLLRLRQRASRLSRGPS